MAELLISDFIIFSFVIFVQIEIIINLVYSKSILFIKYLQLFKSLSISKFNNCYNVNLLFLLLLLFICIFSKNILNSNFIYNIYIFLMITYLFNNIMKFNKDENSFITIILPFFIVYLFIFSLIESIFSFFFLVELYGVLYFFFYSSVSKNFFNSILNYKNTVMLLL